MCTVSFDMDIPVTPYVQTTVQLIAAAHTTSLHAEATLNLSINTLTVLHMTHHAIHTRDSPAMRLEGSITTQPPSNH